jgi:transposase-like protein
VKELGTDPKQAFPGHGQLKPEQLEIDRLRRVVAKLRAERDILKKAAAYVRGTGSRPLSTHRRRWYRCSSFPRL